MTSYSLNMQPFPPTVDGRFLVEQPQDLISSNLFKQCSVLLGSSANDGIDSMLEFLPDTSLQSNTFELSSSQLHSAMSRMFSSFSTPLIDLIKFQYGVFDNEDDQRMNTKRFFGLQSVVADKEVVCKVDRLAKKVANDGNKVRYFGKKKIVYLDHFRCSGISSTLVLKIRTNQRYTMCLASLCSLLAGAKEEQARS